MSVPPPPPRRRARVGLSTAPPSPPAVDPAARAARRATERRVASETGRGPILVILSVVVAVALIGVGVLIALDRGKDTPDVDTTTRVDLTVNPAALDSTSPYLTVADFPSDTSDAVQAALETYVDIATVTPARKGKPVADTDLVTIFDQGAVARLGTADRDVVLDEGLPKAQGRVRVSAPPSDLFALADADGKVLLVTAIVQLDVQVQVASGTANVSRVGSIVFAPQSDGTWKITAWTLHVERSGAGVSGAPTTTAPPTPTTVAG